MNANRPPEQHTPQVFLSDSDAPDPGGLNAQADGGWQTYGYSSGIGLGRKHQRVDSDSVGSGSWVEFPKGAFRQLAWTGFKIGAVVIGSGAIVIMLFDAWIS